MSGPPTAGRRGDGSKSEHGCSSRSEKTEKRREQHGGAQLLDCDERPVAKERDAQLARRTADELAQTVANEAGGEHQHVGLGGNPEDADGKYRRDARGEPESGNTGGTGLGDPLAHGIPRGNVPRDEHRHLGHDAAGEIVRRGEAGELLQRIGHETRFLQATLAVCTLPYVRLEGCNAKTLLAIEEQIELSRK